MYSNRKITIQTGLEITASTVEFIKKVESLAYPEEMQQLEYIECIEDLEEAYGCALTNTTIVTGEDWYFVYENRKKHIELIDLAALPTKARSALYEIYDLIVNDINIQANKQNKLIKLCAREATSYPLIKRMVAAGQYLVLKDSPTVWTRKSKIPMHNMILRPIIKGNEQGISLTAINKPFTEKPKINTDYEKIRNILASINIEKYDVFIIPTVGYGDAILVTSKEFSKESKMSIISSHIDTVYENCWYYKTNDGYVGTFDNSITNKILLDMLNTGQIPTQMVAVFTNGEEIGCFGATGVARHFANCEVDYVLSLDVTEECFGIEDATLENSNFRSAVMEKIHTENIGDLSKEYGVPDEAYTYGRYFNSASFCLPVKGDYHSDIRGCKILDKTIENYPILLKRIINDLELVFKDKSGETAFQPPVYPIYNYRNSNQTFADEERFGGTSSFGSINELFENEMHGKSCNEGQAYVLKKDHKKNTDIKK